MARITGSRHIAPPYIASGRKIMGLNNNAIIANDKQGIASIR